jgi:hypothetical protein
MVEPASQSPSPTKTSRLIMNAELDLRTYGHDIDGLSATFFDVRANCLISNNANRQLLCMTENLILSNAQRDNSGKIVSQIGSRDDPNTNIALSHVAGDKLVVNRGQGYGWRDN